MRPIRVGRIKVSFYRKANGRWIAVFYDLTGKRYAPEKATQKLAEAEARKIIADTCSTESVEEQTAESILAPYGVSVLEAARYYANQHGGVIAKTPISDVIQEAMRIKERDTSPKNADFFKKYWKRFENDFPDRNIGEVSATEINKWLTAMDSSGRSRRNYHSTLVTLFRYAQSHGYLPANIKTAPELAIRPKAGKPQKEIFTPDEFQKLLNAATNDLLPATAIGGLAGVRTEEMCPEFPEEPSLMWEDFLWSQKQIFIRPEVAKVGDGRYVPILPALEKILRPWKKAKGKVYSAEKRLDQRYPKLAKAAGIKWKKNGLRHSFGTYRTATTKSISQVSLEMGNSIPMVKRHYQRPVPIVAARKWFKVSMTKKQK